MKKTYTIYPRNGTYMLSNSVANVWNNIKPVKVHSKHWKVKIAKYSWACTPKTWHISLIEEKINAKNRLFGYLEKYHL